MNSVERAKRDLENWEKTHSKIVDKQARVRETILPLVNEKNMALKAFAAGDWAQAKIISNIESKLSPLNQKDQGLEGLIEDARQEIEKAKEALKQTEAERKAREDAYVEKKEAEDRENRIRSLSEEAKVVTRLLREASSRISEIQIRGIEILPDGRPRRTGEMETVLWSLPSQHQVEYEREGYRRLPWAGWRGVFPILPLLSPLAEGAPPPGREVDAGQIALARRAARIEKWRKEFLETEK